MTRQRLNTRRPNLTTEVAWRSPAGPDQKLIVTYGFDDDGKVREAFCAAFRATSDLVALANDACVMFSMLMQHGEELANVADAVGEDRPEGAASGPPSSLIGAIVRRALEIERERPIHSKQT